jgi:UDPglucose 6-dehydrogenase
MVIIKGRGFVGKATEKFLSWHTEVDDVEFDDPPLNIHSERFDQAQWCVICVPSPLGSNGLNDDEIVFKAIRNAELHKFAGNYLVRSTLSLESIDKLEKVLGDRLVVWPEFIRANHWEEDAVNPKLIVLGGYHAATFAKTFDLMPRTTVFTVSAKEAMAMKLATNTFLSMKVVFANQLRELCESYDVNYANVAGVLRSEPRLGSTHWDTPGPDGSRGFGGHCFPKDSTTYKTELQNNGIDATMLEQMLNINRKLRDEKN